MATTETTARGIDTHAFMAKDIDRARKFYEGVLGLTPTIEFPGGVEYTLSDGSTFGLFASGDGPFYPAGGIMFGVIDVDAATKAVKDAGGTIYGEPADYPPCRTAWCGDTEGNNFAVHKRKDGTFGT